MRSKRIQNPALGDCPTAALADQIRKLSMQCRQVRNLGLDRGQMLLREFIDSSAGSLSIVGEIEEGADLIDAEA